MLRLARENYMAVDGDALPAGDRVQGPRCRQIITSYNDVGA